MDPLPSAEREDIGTLSPSSEKPIRFVIDMAGDEFRRLVNYPIIVESYGDVKKEGALRRKWLRHFTEKERKVISRYYAKFYGWYLVSGHPRRILGVSPRTIHILQKAEWFFAMEDLRACIIKREKRKETGSGETS